MNVIITDGDSQEKTQIDNMRDKIEEMQHNLDHGLQDGVPEFRSLHRVRCGWHIVHKGFLRHCHLKCRVPVENHDSFDKQEATVKAWVYSRMRPGYCETEEEVCVSKGLLQAHLSSNHVKGIFSFPSVDNCPSQNIISWIQQHVEPLEAHYLHLYRKQSRHFDSHMNTPHEGTNNGLKSHGSTVLASHSVAQAANTMNTQTFAKCSEIKQMAAKDFKSNALWSKLPLKDDVTELCLALVQSQWEQSKSKYSIF